MQQEGAAAEGIVVDDVGRNGRVVQNSHIAGAFFLRRQQLLLEHVVNSEGHLSHYWVIFEWQHHGSACLLYEDANLDTMSGTPSAEGDTGSDQPAIYRRPERSAPASACPGL